MFYSVSTASMANGLLRSLTTLQRDLSRAQEELSSGRVTDIGAKLGAMLSSDVSMRATLDDMQSIAQTNKIVSARLDQTSVSLAGLAADAKELFSNLLLAQNDGGTPETMLSSATAAMNKLTATLNASDGQSYIFGGINSSEPPVSEFLSGATPNRTSFDVAFEPAFGMTQSDPAVSSIAPEAMQAFIDGPLADEFSAANWSGNWSAASNEPLRNRISLTQTLDTSVSANEAAFRDLAKGYAMLSNMSVDRLNGDAYQTVIRSAAASIQRGMTALIGLQADVGFMQRQVADSGTSIMAQSDLLENHIGVLENIDPTEVSVRINSLMTQLELSYTLTARLQSMSLAKYL